MSCNYLTRQTSSFRIQHIYRVNHGELEKVDVMITCELMFVFDLLGTLITRRLAHTMNSMNLLPLMPIEK